MTGHWVDIKVEWHEEQYVHCDVCGRLIPTRKWVFSDGETEVTACEQACEELYESYVKPVHGGVAR